MYLSETEKKWTIDPKCFFYKLTKLRDQNQFIIEEQIIQNVQIKWIKNIFKSKLQPQRKRKLLFLYKINCIRHAYKYKF